MLIKLNVLKDQACAQIYAFAEEKEKSFLGSRFAKIVHNPKTPAMTFPKEPVHNHDHDLFITFHSNMSFEHFCQKFMDSEFNEPQNYSLSHNCSEAAYFALKLAIPEFSNKPKTALGQNG